MLSSDSNTQLPTLPPEIIGRILSLALTKASRSFARAVALLSKEWHVFGLTQLYSTISLYYSDGSWCRDPWDPDPEELRRPSPLDPIWAQPSLGLLMTELTVYGPSNFGGYSWEPEVVHLTQLKVLKLFNTEVDLSQLSGCQGLEELILVTASVTNSKSFCFPSLLRLKLVDWRYFHGVPEFWKPSAFPKLEALAVYKHADRTCLDLTTAPTLRALILPVTTDLGPLQPPPQVLFDLDSRSLGPDVVAALRLRRPTHLRCLQSDAAGPLAELLERGDAAVQGLETLYCIDPVGYASVFWAGTGRLVRAAGAQGIAVVFEADTLPLERFGFDHFIEHHSKSN